MQLSVYVLCIRVFQFHTLARHYWAPSSFESDTHSYGGAVVAASIVWWSRCDAVAKKILNAISQKD